MSIAPIAAVGISALPAMPSMPAAMSPLGAVSPAGDGGGTPRVDGATGAPADFAGALSSAISGLNTTMVGSERLSEAIASGQIEDPTSALVEIEKADLAFQTAMQVRNKLVDGWQEVSRMTV